MNMDQDIGMHFSIEDLEWPILRALDSHWRSAWLLDRRPAFTLVLMEEIRFAHVLSPSI